MALAIIHTNIYIYIIDMRGGCRRPSPAARTRSAAAPPRRSPPPRPSWAGARPATRRPARGNGNRYHQPYYYDYYCLVCIYIYIYRERERYNTYVYIYIYTHIHTHTVMYLMICLGWRRPPPSPRAPCRPRPSGQITMQIMI